MSQELAATIALLLHGREPYEQAEAIKSALDFDGTISLIEALAWTCGDTTDLRVIVKTAQKIREKHRPSMTIECDKNWWEL